MWTLAYLSRKTVYYNLCDCSPIYIFPPFTAGMGLNIGNVMKLEPMGVACMLKLLHVFEHCCLKIAVHNEKWLKGTVHSPLTGPLIPRLISPSLPPAPFLYLFHPFIPLPSPSFPPSLFLPSFCLSPSLLVMFLPSPPSIPPSAVCPLPLSLLPSSSPLSPPSSPPPLSCWLIHPSPFLLSSLHPILPPFSPSLSHS